MYRIVNFAVRPEPDSATVALQSDDEVDKFHYKRCVL